MKLFVDMSIFLSLDGFSVNFEIYYGNEFMANGHIDTYTTWLFKNLVQILALHQPSMLNNTTPS